MAFVNKDQIQRAKDIDAIDYVLKHEHKNIRKVGECYRLIDHPSISISENGWYWHSQCFGSKTALDYLIMVRGYDFVDAVRLLMNEKPWDQISELIGSQTTLHSQKKSKTVPLSRKAIILPKKNTNNSRVIAYLKSRGIERAFIIDCINNKSLYESAKHHNCVFVGFDDDSIARYATLRSIFSSFKCDVKGSDKSFGFNIMAENEAAKSVAVFESAIDCLSHQTLCKLGFIEQFDGWRISLGCTASVALKSFLERKKGVNQCLICTDNDVAGEHAAERIMSIPNITMKRCLPYTGKDWNECLLALQREKRLENVLNKAQKGVENARGS